MLADYARQMANVFDRETGEIHKAQIFVAVLGTSSCTYAEAMKTGSAPRPFRSAWS
ncbi:MAG: hypothetical protein P4L42_17435 [Desulfocapsaceae bacterium]|nr:hypothetical protein [Desulfocapsaceae bacterium]